jgi:hypothetical protein
LAVAFGLLIPFIPILAHRSFAAEYDAGTLNWVPISVLLKQGWRKTSPKECDHVTVEGWMAKDGSKSPNAKSVILPDGRRVFAGSSQDLSGVWVPTSTVLPSDSYQPWAQALNAERKANKGKDDPVTRRGSTQAVSHTVRTCSDREVSASRSRTPECSTHPGGQEGLQQALFL